MNLALDPSTAEGYSSKAQRSRVINLRNENALPLYLAHGVDGPTESDYDPFPKPYHEALVDVG